MVFSSTVFLFLFLPLVVGIYYNPWVKGRAFKNRFLLVASLIFYAWGEPLYLFLLIASIVFGWKIGELLENKKEGKRGILIAGVGLYVVILFVFKYFSFLVRQLGLFLHEDYSFFEIELPIGISFFTFQLLSYLFDIYYGKSQAKKSLLDVGLYVAFFPQLIAGPIVRYKSIEREIEDRRETMLDFTNGMVRFSFGLGKKVLIANYVGVIADNIFNMDGSLSVITAWIGAFAYTMQIYYDFSGYSDMAIGLGQMFGFHFPENFNYPYAAGSVTEFWHRWHISLGAWFRDYVYIPLGGNRVTRERWILNLLVVWALTGIWHGANWTFLFWGLFYFGLLLIEKLTGFVTHLGRFSHIYTMIAVMMGWVIFRSPSITEGISYLGMMYGVGAQGVVDETLLYYARNSGNILMVATVLVFPVIPKMKKLGEWFDEVAEPLMAVGIFFLSLLVTICSTYNPFIYYNF